MYDVKKRKKKVSTLHLDQPRELVACDFVAPAAAAVVARSDFLTVNLLAICWSTEVWAGPG